jgi:hypothetical protein
MIFTNFFKKIIYKEIVNEEIVDENVTINDEKHQVDAEEDWIAECSARIGKTLKIIFKDHEGNEKIFYCFVLVRNNSLKKFKLVCEKNNEEIEFKHIKSYTIYEH